jgi:hypothetical protein
MGLSVAAHAAIAFIVVSHTAIFAFDFTQVVPVLDFIARPDGSRSDPNDLLPIEMCYAGVTAMAFGTVAASFVMAIAFGVGTVQGSSAASCWFHTAWAGHMVWRWQSWRRMMHPDAGKATQPDTFLAMHIIWAVLSAWLAMLPASKGVQSKRKAP